MSYQSVQPRQDRAGLGISMMLVAWLFFACVDTSVKWLILAGLPAMQLAFARYAVQLMLTFAVDSGCWRGLPQVTRRQHGLLFVRAALLVTATVLNFYALRFLSLTVTSAIMFSAPIIVSALSVALLGERVGPWRWFAILLGFGGVLVVIRPLGDTFHWASVLIIYNAFALAFYSIITRRLAGTVAPQIMQLYLGTLGTLALLPFALANWSAPGSTLEWALFAGVGAFAWVGHELFSRAHNLAEASALMPFSYSFLIFMTASSFLVFGDWPDGPTIVGAVIIVLSGLVIWWRENLRRGQGADV